MGGIVLSEVDGTPALGFDTGLDAKAFAQTKSAQLMTQPGWRVSPEGRVEPWKLEGVIEREGTLVIWGAAFIGERLDALISNDSRKDEALDALRYWIQARIVLEKTQPIEPIPTPWPSGALIDPQGTILFPPDQLIKRTIEAQGKDAWRTAAVRWTHPDRSGEEASVFAGGTMLYRIFCGSPPFLNQDSNLLRQDIREGVFLPLRFAAPGLEPNLATLISGSMESFTRSKQGKPSEKQRHITLETLRDCLGFPGSAKADSYFHSLSEEEQVKLRLEQERYRKKQDLTVKTKRFLIRNTTIIAAILAAVCVIWLIGKSIIRDRTDSPTTRGMTPMEVVETYYGAIGALDHILMDACVIKNAGKEDINLVTHYFVINKVRQAYEMNTPGIIPAQQWIDSGAAPTAAAVFGVSDLRLEGLDTDERDGEVSFRASFLLWLPQSRGDFEDSGQEETGSIHNIPDGAVASLPRSAPLTDTIRLVLYNDAWRIAEIQRE
jgi:hypothetical protein